MDKKEDTEQSCFTCIHHVSGGASCRYSLDAGLCNKGGGRYAFNKQGSRTRNRKQIAIDKDEIAIEQIIFDSD